MRRRTEFLSLNEISDSDLLEYYLRWDDAMRKAFSGEKSTRVEVPYSPEFQAMVNKPNWVSIGLDGKPLSFWSVKEYVKQRGLIKDEAESVPTPEASLNQDVKPKADDPSEPEFAKCSDCGGTFKVKELSSDYDHHNGWELPAYEQHNCPVCPDGGNIDDYFDSSTGHIVTPAELERLALYVEEVGESLQIVGKVLRFGFESTHPDGGPTNRQLLEKEVADVQVAIGLLDGSVLTGGEGDLDPTVMAKHAKQKREKLPKFLLFNSIKNICD